MTISIGLFQGRSTKGRSAKFFNWSDSFRLYGPDTVWGETLRISTGKGRWGNRITDKPTNV